MKKVYALIAVMMSSFCLLAASKDSVGVVGIQIGKLFDKFGMSETLVGAAVSLIGAFLFRLIQIGLQKLPTKWKFVDNKLTLGIVNSILAKLFGKTTMLYNARVSSESDPVSMNELKKEAAKHLSRNGGILKEFDNAMKELKK